MKVIRWVAGAVLACVPLVSAGAQQQSAQCAGQSQVQVRDACQLAVDLFQYMAPQLGTAIAGGNATLGQGGTMGGFGHFSIGVRANAVSGSLPEVDQISPNLTGIQQRTIPTKENQPLPMPVVDAAVGIFRGIPVGLTNVGGVDLLANVAYIPTLDQDGTSLATPSGSWKFGYGVRLGILQESVAIPGVAVTYLKRDLPTLSVSGETQSGGAGDQTSLAINDFSVNTGAWRLVASKGLGFLGLAAGVGQDRYTQSATIRATVQSGGAGFSSGAFALDQDVTRTTMFADLSINFPVLKLVGEVGQVSGGDVHTYNTFSKDANASRLYASVGLRLAW